ncbi:signal recognition particle protein [Sediminispirochaeta smaragdinae]|uniref:Signal recognition particle protein n=1 Tax=Sediminispirochaeta smaragdinae (strain DSM 11293 / JCM 15392 / SEBR 4228) TaxID=573413 RepID=E1R6H9_SEDSS|nr:signal recognition particle protein [Sediminispirochaeta smaragdinae]ADK80997.1 signal recognition particle protein [Sediminispirochaeta smaragdinae DSM 11293]
MLERISDKFSDIFRQLSGKATISEKNIQDAVEEIKVALLEADVNLRVVRRFVNRTIEEAKGEAVLKAVNPGQQFVKIVNDKIVQLLGDEHQDLELKGPDALSSILMMGLQGSGKTTTSAKLGLRLKKEGRRVLLVAADLVRPAAVDQLKVLGKQVDLEVFSLEKEKDPVKLVGEAKKYAIKSSFNTMIVDTSGRLHLDEEMMKQIVDIKRVLDPQEQLFVADSMTGQEAVTIAKSFDEQVGISGVVLTKFDSDTRGGAALSLKSVTGKPIKYVGVGEKPEDLDPFYPERIASRILGMGDVVSLVEKAQETIDLEEAAALQEKMISATFTLEDYLESFARMRKMGSVQSLLEMIPGAKGAISEDDIDEKEMKKEEAIILSMTIVERRNHRIIGPSRRKRIAKGSGSSVAEVNRLIKRFEKMRLMMKKVSKNKKYQAKLMQNLGV